MTPAQGAPWWREGVLYQVYPRSFADGNGDGIGDLRGLLGRLNYLEWLGVDGVWLTPIMPSPDTDWGYDVADYCDVHRDFGTLADLDELVAAAGGRGIRVLLDLVPNHTSERHPWFLESRSGRETTRRDWYVWAGPKPDGRRRTTGSSRSAGPPGRSTRRAASTTCAASCRSSPTSTGGTRTCGGSSTRFSASGSGEGAVVSVNLSGEPRVVEDVEGEIALRTTRQREGERPAGRLELAPWEGAIVTA